MSATLTLNANKLTHNAVQARIACARHGISSLVIVVKALSGWKKAVELIGQTLPDFLGDSRIENLSAFRHIDIPKMLLRSPSLQECSRCVRVADVSLVSELPIVQSLNLAAQKSHRRHGVILMIDLGDLREGILDPEEAIATAIAISEMDSIDLLGIGTNLTCYGGVLPSQENLTRLVEIKNKIEQETHLWLRVVSGGNSSMFGVWDQFPIPEGISQLRIGESLLLGRETAFGNPIEGFHDDIFQLDVDIIEIKQKPSLPIGEATMNSFGEIPQIEDMGIRRRGILSIGKQDILPEHLIPIDPQIRIIGASSDHLIVDLTDTNYQLGEAISFTVDYPGLLSLTTSKYIKKKIIEE